jgi:hypothetical protein
MPNQKGIIEMILNIIPILVMIVLIPYVKNDYTLTVIYLVIIAVSLLIKRTKNDFLFLGFGFVIMLASEYLFISTGVETFERNSLFGIMPLWLPFLWSYAFVVMKRVITILDK